MAQLEIEIDALTNSVIEIETGVSRKTRVVEISNVEYLKKQSKGWRFDWPKQFKEKAHKTYSLELLKQKGISHGLISISNRDGFILVSLIELAPYNIGKHKKYNGCAGNLFAFACKLSFMNKNEGFILFEAKTSIIENYKTKLKAQQIGGSNRMYIETNNAITLVKRYFPDYELPIT